MFIKFLTIEDHHSNYRQLEVKVNTNQNIRQALWSSNFQNFGISQCPEIYPNIFRFPILWKCSEDKDFVRSAFSTKKWIPLNFFTSSRIEKKTKKKTKFARTEQLASLRKRTHVASELFSFYVELWAEDTNPQHRHTPFAISEINFSENFI